MGPEMRKLLKASAVVFVTCFIGVGGASGAQTGPADAPGSDVIVKGIRPQRHKDNQGNPLVQFMTHTRGLNPTFGLLNCAPTDGAAGYPLQCKLPVVLTQTDLAHPRLGYGELHVALFDQPASDRRSRPIIHDWANWDAKDASPIITSISFPADYRPTAVKGWISQWIGHPSRPLRDKLLASNQ